jgi:hypothetical protein
VEALMYRLSPKMCMPGDTVHADTLKDWPAMSMEAVKAFKRFTGCRWHGRLVRKGKWIFAVNGAHLAECVYAHERNFP